MPYNGSGVFQRLYSWTNDKLAGIKIRADRMDNEMNGMATALSNCVTRDGQSPATANLPMAGFRLLNVGVATTRSEYATYAQVQDGVTSWADAGGAADAITANYGIDVTTLINGQLCFVRASAANATTTPTFSPDGITARTIVKNGGQPLSAGDIAGDGHELILRYDLPNTRWELLNPALPPDGSITTAKIANGAVDATKLARPFTLMTAQTASGGNIDFTGIPSWATRITIIFNNISTNGISQVTVQVGAGSFVTSGYAGSAVQPSSPNTVSGSATALGTAFAIDQAATGAAARFGHAILTKVSGNDWVYSCITGRSDAAAVGVSGGGISLGGALDRIRINAGSGTSFDTGNFNVIYE